MLIEKVEYLNKFFEENIQDEYIRYFIFNKKNGNLSKLLNSTSSYIKYMENILNLSFIYIYSSFQRACIDSEEDDFTDIFAMSDHNVSRVVNYLKDTFVKHACISDLVEFILTDIQFDMKRGEDSNLKQVLPGFCEFKNDFNLIKYFKLISEYNSKGTRIVYDMDEVVDMFCELIDNMTFLRAYNLVKENDELFIFKKKNVAGLTSIKHFYDKISTCHTIIENENISRSLYLLNTMEFDEFNDRLVLRYVSIDGLKYQTFYASDEKIDREDECWIEYDPEEFFSEVTCYTFEQKDELRIPKTDYDITIHTINYKYIKNLALSISDVFNSNAEIENTIIEAFGKKYNDIFGGKNGEITAADWDAIIVMLLIEAGPTTVLQILISKHRQVFYDICKNLAKRISNPLFKLDSKNKDRLDNEVKKIISNKMVGQNSKIKFDNTNLKNRIFSKAATYLIISALTSYSKEENPEEETKKVITAGNVYDNIILLNELKREKTTSEKIEYTSIILGETFKYLICFYEGVFEYGIKKAEFDSESSNYCLTNSRICVYQKDLLDTFLTSAKNKADALSHYDTTNPEDSIKLMNLWINLCKNKKGDKGLYVALGKHEVMNLFDFNYVIKKYVGKADTIDKDNVDDWIDLTINLLEYFKTGSFDNTPINHNLFNAVYPFVSIYNSGNENYDGYHTGTFSITIDVNDDGKEDYHYDIRVLTEFKYNLSGEFYCLPNILRSNKRWWIDPLLIDYVTFNNIFNKRGEK